MAKDYEVLNELTPKTQELHREIFDKGYEQGYEAGKSDIRESMQTVYDKGYQDRLKMSKKQYQRGLEDVWDVMKKIAFKETEGGIPLCELKEMFGEDSCLLTEMLRNYAVTTVVYTIKAYEEKKQKQIKAYEEKKQKQDDKIKVGDEVTERYLPDKGIVTRANEECCYVMWNDGSSGNSNTDDLHKTGKHIDGITEILKQLQEG